MRNLKILALVCFVMLVCSSSLMAAVEQGPPVVGAPLDGGLLTILGAAGVAYFVARKKKKLNG